MMAQTRSETAFESYRDVVFQSGSMDSLFELHYTCVEVLH